MNVAFIPVRGGSKSIPLKNIKEMNGKPLAYWAIKAASESKNIDWVYVATDSGLIKSTVESFGMSKVEVVDRSPESASDTASTEFAMLEFSEKYDFENIILIQATSPLLTVDDIDGGFELFNSDDCDSVLSVVRQYRFIWKEKDELAEPVNYDVFHRPRRQEFDGYLMENGAFYITSRERLISSKNRVSGRIKAYEMPEDTAFEIDEPNDWIIIEQLMKKHGKKQTFKNVKAVFTDCDGCLTDGGMYYSENGDELKKFNTHDGMAFQMLRERGIITGMITSENVELNRRRAEKLKLDYYIPGCKDKAAAIRKICEDQGICLGEVVYIGDDVNDIEAIKAVGYGCCPANAISEAKEVADYITKARGGEGVIREVAGQIIR